MLGGVELTEQGYTFVPGALLDILKQQGNKLALIDAPLTNRHFQCFIQRLLTQRECWVNGEKITLPPDFYFEFSPPAKVTKPANIHNISMAKLDAKEDPKETDIFYLNHHNYHLLFKQTVIKNGKLSPDCGWLHSPAKQKIVVQTQPLTAGEIRRIYSELASESMQDQDFYWRDMTLESLSKPSSLPALNAKTINNKESCLIETDDPHFVTSCLLNNENDAVLISAKTDTNELLEELIEESSSKKVKDLREIRFSQQIKNVAAKLLAGKTVILHGPLSAELYSALESLLAKPPQLKLSTHEKAQIVPGQLIVVTTPLTFPTVLPQHNKSTFTVSRPELWEAYRQQIPVKDFVLLDKIQQFYQLAATIPHGQIGMPPLPHLTFERLLNMLNVLKSNQYSIKSLFHYDYDKDSEEYAYLNVLAKKIFGNSEEKPSIRLYKFKQYPETDDYQWRRANCFNGSALQPFISEKASSITPLLQDYSKNQDKYQLIQKNADPQAKIAERLSAILKTNNGITLKGPPGSGKTFLALAYANDAKREAFFGEEAMISFLESKPAPGKESVLILDEANLVVPGHWEYLTPLLEHHDDKKPIVVNYHGREIELKGSHKVIFTGNPESYAGREYHPIMQNSPTLYLKSWTPDTLKKYLLKPLINQLSPGKTPFDFILNNIINVFELGKQLLPAGTVSLRELNQLVCRWLYFVDRGFNEKDALYQAAIRECFNCFQTEFDRINFQEKLQAILSIQPDDTLYAINTTKEIFKKRPKSYFFCNKLQRLLAEIHEDLQLAESFQGQCGIDKAPYVKSGVLIEGDSGIGKSVGLKMLLSLCHLKESNPEDLLNLDKTDFSQAYIQFTVSGNLEHDAKILRLAFDKGCKVILDELNLGPDLEGLLNHLLTGHTPEGLPAKQKGFFIFASQNDARHCGTLSLSKALTNRLHAYHPEPYTKKDLLEFANDALPTFTPKRKDTIVNAYLHQEEKDPDYVNSRTFLEGLSAIRANELDISALADQSFFQQSHCKKSLTPIQKISTLQYGPAQFFDAQEIWNFSDPMRMMNSKTVVDLKSKL